MSFLSRSNSQRHRANHQSLDNLGGRSQPVNGSSTTSRSHQQLSEELDGVSSSSNDLDCEDSPLDTLIGFILGCAALVCTFGVVTILSILYVTVRPFSTSTYRRLAAQLGAGTFLDALALLLPNTKLCLTGDSDVPSPVGTSLLVCNHLMDGDWWPMLMLGRCIGLRGSIKVFLRKELLQINHHRIEGRKLSQRRCMTDVVTSSPQQQLTAQSKRVTFGRTNGSPHIGTSPQLSLAGKLLHFLLEFPILSAENDKDYMSDREALLTMLRSFAQNNGADAPVHLLLYPEGWSLRDKDRKAVLAKSNEFAKREGRPQLKHLLLPRTTGFNACLESLRESSPVVYDATMAYRGYDGSLQPSIDLNLPTLWHILRRKVPSEVHVRIKRYSMEEVLQDGNWLDKQWAEKDRLLSHFSRHQSFPTDNRGFCQHHVFDSRHHSVENSALSLIRLLLLPCAVPFILLLFLPIAWTILWIWLAHQAYRLLFCDAQLTNGSTDAETESSTSHTPGSAGVDSAMDSDTPFVPATPFVSPSTTNWRGVSSNRNGSVRR